MTRCHPCVQGVGQALYEGVHYDGETGQILTGSLLDYAIPRRGAAADPVAQRPLGEITQTRRCNF